VTERAVGSRVERRGDDPPGVRRVADPSDAELADLYARALCLLWPSLAEGYGIPLLEAMACGTPFLSADVGAARELAIDARQVLPLDGDRWVAELERYHTAGVADLRARSAETARRATWERSTDAMVRAIGRSLPGR
jgi:glycosyltransferase involved in cell wall biosynthesis